MGQSNVVLQSLFIVSLHLDLMRVPYKHWNEEHKIHVEHSPSFRPHLENILTSWCTIINAVDSNEVHDEKQDPPMCLKRKSSP